MKEGMAVPDTEAPRTPGTGDVPESWGFHLLQELRRLEDKMDARFEAMDAKMDARFEATDGKIAAVESRMETRLATQISEVRQELRSLRYWSWGAILTVVAGAVATILTVLLH